MCADHLSCAAEADLFTATVQVTGVYLALVVMLRMKNLDHMNQFILPTVSAANVVVTLLTCHRCYEDWRLESSARVRS